MKSVTFKANCSSINEPKLKPAFSDEPEETTTKKVKKSRSALMKERQLLLAHLSEKQLDCYEVYRRASLNKNAIKRIMSMITGSPVSQNVILAVAGIAKIFIGEIIEMGMDAKRQANLGKSSSDVDDGLEPRHIREAVRILKQKGRGDCEPHDTKRKRLLWK